MIMKRIILLFACFIPLYGNAQYNVKSIISEGRPYIEDTAKFVRDLRAMAEQIVLERLGKVYYEMVDSTYFYPWYYKNVYFNSAPSEMNYRVAFWLNRTKETQLNFELAFDKTSLELIDPINLFLPNCKWHPSECRYISSDEAKEIAARSFKNYFKEVYHTSFRYDADHRTLVWICSVQQFTTETYGDTGYAVIDANNGKVLKSEIKKSVRMGR
jgi:hypothetical protein